MESVESKSLPLVSIVIPVFNGGNFLKDAIDSALAQDYPNIEVIVVNDGSTDLGVTEKIALSYGGKIKYLKKKNGGVASALNLGISSMEGDFFSWLSHDDVYLPSKISNEIYALFKSKDVRNIVVEGYRVVDKNKRYLYTVNLRDTFSELELSKGLYSVIKGGVNGCSTLIHKSHFKRVGLFDENLPTTQDYEMWFRMFQGQNIIYLESSNVLSRSHEEQGSKKAEGPHIFECNELWINIARNVTENEVKKNFGTRCNYLKELYEFLKLSSYKDAANIVKIDYLTEIGKEIFNQTNVRMLEEFYELTNFDRDKLKPWFELSRLNTDKKPSILFLLADLGTPSGLNNATLRIADCLEKDFFCVVTTEEGEGRSIRMSPPWNPTEISSDRLLIFANTLGFDYIVNSYHFYDDSLELYRIAKYYKVKTIALNHESIEFPLLKSKPMSFFWKKIDRLRLADKVVWLNSVSADFYNLFNQNGFYIPNFIEQEQNKLEPIKKDIDIISIGRFDDPMKALDAIVTIFSYVSKVKPNSTITILGKIDLKLKSRLFPNLTIGELIEKFSLKGKINFEGQVKNVNDYLRRSKVNVVTSDTEGFGLSILEASTQGVPTVCFDSFVGKDIVVNNETGFLVSKGDLKEFSKKIIELLTDRNLHNRLSENAKRIVSKFDSDDVSMRWKHMLKDDVSDPEKKKDKLDSTNVAHFLSCFRTSSSQNEKLWELERNEFKKFYEYRCQLLGLQDEILQLKKQNRDLLLSKSWRITAPLRKIMSCLSKCRKELTNRRN